LKLHQLALESEKRILAKKYFSGFNIIMVILTHTQNNKYSEFRGADNTKRKPHLINSAFIKHQLHEKRIDEFFWTNVETPHEKFSPLALLGAVAGVVIPVLSFGKKQHPQIKLNSIKNIFKSSNIHYGSTEIVTVGCSSAIGGLIGGLLDRKEPKKLDKIQEATFQLMNISFPAILVGKAVDLCSKTKKLNNPAVKVFASTIGMFMGAYAAVKLANQVDNKLFDKYNLEPDRKFKKKDFIIHLDDLIGTMVLAKVPFVDKIGLEKLLPAIYTWSGFNVGEK